MDSNSDQFEKGLSKEVLIEIVKNFQEGITILNTNGKIHYANHAAEIILGIHREEISQRYYNAPQWKILGLDGEPIPENDLPFALALTSKKKVVNYRHSIQWPDGQKKFLNIQVIPLFNEKEVITELIAIIEDITGFYLIEQDRNRISTDYKNLFHNMVNALALHKIITNENGQPIDYLFLDINKKFEEFTGLSRSAVIGKTYSEVFKSTPDPNQKWVKFWGKIALTGEPDSTEDYSEELKRWYLVSGFSPQKGYFLASFINITDIKKTQALLEKSETRYKSVFKNVPVGIGLTNFEGQIYELNQQMLDILKYTPQELQNMNITQIYNNISDREKFITKVQQDGKIRDYEIILRDKLGAKIYTMLNSDLITLDNKPYLITSFRDLTQLKETEAERQKLEDKIRTTQKLESLGTLAGGIAHDFNNLLVGILGNADLALMDVQKDTSLYETINEIKIAARRASDLSQQMLLYAGKRQIKKIPINLTYIVNEMSSLLKRSISKQATLLLQNESNIADFYGDPTQIRQIVMNLITNASDALENENGNIEICTYQRFCDQNYFADTYLQYNLPDGIYCVLEVKDTGKGMDSTVIEKIFEPFFTTKFSGRGLGLSAVLGIVKGHNGAIKIESEIGKGSIFTVLFPIITSQIGNQKQSQDSSTNKLPSSLTVLIIDDEPSVLEIGTKYLNRLNYQVYTARSGFEGINLFETHQDTINLIILDLTMPVLNGYDTFQQLRKLSPSIPIIITSGFAEYDVNLKFANEKILGFIHKPFDLHDFERILMKL